MHVSNVAVLLSKMAKRKSDALERTSIILLTHNLCDVSDAILTQLKSRLEIKRSKWLRATSNDNSPPVTSDTNQRDDGPAIGDVLQSGELDEELTENPSGPAAEFLYELLFKVPLLERFFSANTATTFVNQLLTRAAGRVEILKKQCYHRLRLTCGGPWAW